MHDYIIIIVATMAMFIIPHDGSCLYYYYSISIILSSNDGSHYYFVVVVRRLGVDVLGAFIHNYTFEYTFHVIDYLFTLYAWKVPLIYYSFM